MRFAARATDTAPGRCAGVVLSGKSLAEIASTLRCASALKTSLDGVRTPITPLRSVPQPCQVRHAPGARLCIALRPKRMITRTRLQQPSSPRPSSSAAHTRRPHRSSEESHTRRHRLRHSAPPSLKREERESGAALGVSKTRPDRVLCNTISSIPHRTHSLIAHDKLTTTTVIAAPAQPASRRRCCGARAAASRRPRRTC